MKLWFCLLIANVLVCYSTALDSVAFEDVEWWELESDAEKEERQLDFAAFVEGLKIIGKESLDEEDSRLIEWRSLVFSREYLQLATRLEVISEKVASFHNFLNSGRKMLENMEHKEDDLMLKSFLVIVLKTRETMLKIHEYHSNYQSDSSRQKSLVAECEQILGNLKNSQKSNQMSVQLVQEALLWKANFESRHDDLIVSINSYNINSGSWLYDAILLGYYPSDDDNKEIMGHDASEPDEDAMEILETAREIVRVYQEMITGQDNETLEIMEHSEL